MAPKFPTPYRRPFFGRKSIPIRRVSPFTKPVTLLTQLRVPGSPVLKALMPTPSPTSPNAGRLGAVAVAPLTFPRKTAVEVAMTAAAAAIRLLVDVFIVLPLWSAARFGVARTHAMAWHWTSIERRLGYTDRRLRTPWRCRTLGRQQLVEGEI